MSNLVAYELGIEDDKELMKKLLKKESDGVKLFVEYIDINGDAGYYYDKIIIVLDDVRFTILPDKIFDEEPKLFLSFLENCVVQTDFQEEDRFSYYNEDIDEEIVEYEILHRYEEGAPLYKFV